MNIFLKEHHLPPTHTPPKYIIITNQYNKLNGHIYSKLSKQKQHLQTSTPPHAAPGTADSQRGTAKLTLRHGPPPFPKFPVAPSQTQTHRIHTKIGHFIHIHTPVHMYAPPPRAQNIMTINRKQVIILKNRHLLVTIIMN